VLPQLAGLPGELISSPGFGGAICTVSHDLMAMAGSATRIRQFYPSSLDYLGN
ncbi:MAG: hypothetical protein RIS70_2297, partial [Planctomycetota bacterium]